MLTREYVKGLMPPSAPSSSKRSEPKGPSISDVFRSIAKGLRTHNGRPVAVTAENPPAMGTVVGGPPDFAQLYRNLSPASPTAERVKAAQAFCHAMNDFSISSIMEIWLAARDLLQSSHNGLNIRIVAYTLLISCIKRDELSTGSRLAYYADIVSNSNLSDLPYQLRALEALTKNGRDIANIDLDPKSPFSKTLSRWLKMAYRDVSKSRSGKKSKGNESNEELLHDLLEYLSNVLKFSFSTFQEKEIISLMADLFNICWRTSSKRDLADCLKVISTVLTYGNLPLVSARDCISVMCSVNLIGDSDLQLMALKNVDVLAQSHLSSFTLACLLELLSGPINDRTTSNTVAGAVFFARHYFQNRARGKTFEFSLTTLMASYLEALSLNSLTVAGEVSRNVLALIQNDDILKTISAEEWDSLHSPLEVLMGCAQLCGLLVCDRLDDSQKQELKHGPVQDVPKPPSPACAAIIDTLKTALTFLEELVVSKRYNGSMDSLVNFSLVLCPIIPESAAFRVVQHFKDEHLCNPISSEWHENVETLNTVFVSNSRFSSELRLSALSILEESFEIVLETLDEGTQEVFVKMVFSGLCTETDPALFGEMLKFAKQILIECSLAVFTWLSNVIFVCIAPEAKASAESLPNQGRFRLSRSNSAWPEPSRTSPDDSPRKLSHLATTYLCVTLIECLNRSGPKSMQLFSLLVEIFKSERVKVPDRIEAARLLMRVRVNSAGCVFLMHPKSVDLDILSASIGRNIKRKPETDESDWSKIYCWYHPEDICMFGVNYPTKPSILVGIATTLREADNRDESLVVDTSGAPGRVELDMTQLLDSITGIIEFAAPWELYSYVIAHFSHQLSNMRLFAACQSQIRRLRRVICEQLSVRLAPVAIPIGISKSDILVVLMLSMSSIIAFHPYYPIQDQNDIVKALLAGVSSWEKTAVACIHALSICCYELPTSVKKYLSAIFTTFQTKITNNAASAAILEFLSSLSRQPSLTSNFNIDEFKRVFGMAFKYIDHARDLSKQPSTRVTVAGEEIDSKRLSRYLVGLAYNVIATWFLALKLNDRKVIARYIIRNLVLINGPGSMDARTWAWLDLIVRFTYSDLDLRVYNRPSLSGNSNSARRLWLNDVSIYEIQTDIYTGRSRFIIRRPTGTASFDVMPTNDMLSWSLQESIKTLMESEDLSNSSETLRTVPGTGRQQNPVLLPGFLLSQLMTSSPGVDSKKLPVPLPDEPFVTRAVSTFDLTPVVDFHKVGILYVGPGQTTEEEILANSVGSPAFTRFVQGLGYLIKLKGNKRLYTGGLDTEMDLDGEFAYAWNDKITQLIFHCTTMMPAPSNPDDKGFSNKKRHIGNNYVNVFFNESENPVKIDTIKSQFNFINIAVSPHTASGFSLDQFVERSASELDKGVDENTGNPPFMSNDFFKVRILSGEGVPVLNSASSLKVVSARNLPTYVRNLALSASIFAAVWNCDWASQDYVSNWQYRMQQITQLREKLDIQTAAATAVRESEQKSDVAGTVTSPQGQSDSQSTPSGIQSSSASTAGAAASAATQGATAGQVSSTDDGWNASSSEAPNDNDLLKSLDISVYN